MKNNIEQPTTLVTGKIKNSDGSFRDVSGDILAIQALVRKLTSRSLDECREAVFKLIEISTEAIHQNGGWIGICGEMAADLSLAQRFVDIGVDELSVAVPYLLGVREKICACK